MGDSQRRGPLRRRDRAFNRASRQSGGPNPVSNPGARPVPALGVTIELLKGAAGANLLDPEAS